MEDANRFVTTFQGNSLVDVIGAFAWQPVMKADAKVKKNGKTLKLQWVMWSLSVPEMTYLEMNWWKFDYLCQKLIGEIMASWRVQHN